MGLKQKSRSLSSFKPPMGEGAVMSRAKNKSQSLNGLGGGAQKTVTKGPKSLKLKVAFSNSGVGSAGDLGPCRFVDEVIKADIYLVDQVENFVQADAKEAITCTLLYSTNGDTTMREAPATLLKLESNSDKRFNGRKASIRFSVKDVSYNVDNAQFAVRFAVDDVSGLAVEPFVTPVFTTVRQKLLVNTWTQANGTAATKRDEDICTFFKDEGGHGNCIETIVELVDASGRRVLNGSPVPLKVDLKYEKKTELLSLSLLSLNPESRLVIDEQGWTKIKFRINEVSTRHQGQNFVLVISPDTTNKPQYGDIGAAVCTPIEVRSKRNKPRLHNKEEKKRKAAAAAATSSSDNSRPAKQATYGYDQGGYTRGGGMHGMMNGHGRAVDMDGDISYDGMSGNFSYSAQADVNAPPIMPQNMYDAVHHVNRWTRNVLAVAQQITWQQIGINPNTNQELYSMPNPNELLVSIMQQYNQLVRGSLIYLLGHDEVAGGVQQGADVDTSGGGPGIMLQQGQTVGTSASGGAGSMQNGAVMDYSSGGMLDLGSGLDGFMQSYQLPLGFPGKGGMSGGGKGFTGGLQSRHMSFPSFSFMETLEGVDQLADVDSIGATSGEETVVRVFSKCVRVAGQVKGLPAFDDANNLVGFYNQRQETSPSLYGTPLTKVFFIPLVRAELSPTTATQIKDALVTDLSKQENAEKVFVAKNGPSDVSRIREQAMESYFMAQDNIDF